MLNAIINPEASEKEKVINKISTEKPTLASYPTFGQVNLSERKTHLFYAKPLIHTTEAGINPLVDAAAYIFSWMGKLIQLRSHRNLQQLYNELAKEIQEFRATLTALNYRPEYLSEYIPIATYLLCTTIDNIISNTTWGGEGRWYTYRLANTNNDEMLSRESLLIILERFTQDQEVFIDMLEFIYICLSIGFNYQSSVSGFNFEQLQRIMHSLYKRIYIHNGNFSRVLSPYPLKARSSWTTNNIQHVTRKFERKDKINLSSNRKLILSSPNIKQLRKDLHRITECLRNKSIKIKDKKIHLASLPWVLITGTVGSGKSTFVENSNIKFVIDGKNNLHNTKNKPQDQHWNWSVTANAVLIETPTIPVKPHHQNYSNLYWENLIDLILEERNPSGLNNVTLIISSTEITDKANHKMLITQLTKKISALQDKFGRGLSFNLVINKSDLLPGFCDFFEDYTTEELFQPCGISLPQIITSENMTDNFYKQFDILIKRINKQVIYRLHQERGIESQYKFNIKDFPLQVERLKENLGEVIKKIAKETHHFALQGFYLTSATQSSLKSEAQLPQMMAKHALVKSFSCMDIPAIPKRSYFIKYLLLNGLVSESINSALSAKLAKPNFFDFLSKLTRGF